MIARRHRLGRRTLLRGSAAGLSAAIALPVLEAMLSPHGDALAGGGSLPTRFGVWFWGNGVRLDEWVPAQVGPDFAPSPALQPFADAGVLSELSVVSGLAVPFGQEVVHDVGRAAMLSGSYSVTAPTVGLGGNALLRSIDQIAADWLAPGAPFRSLEVGVSQVGFGGQPDTSSVSWEDPVSPLPAEFSPHALFARLFGDAVDDVNALDARRSILDVVLEDAAALRSRLGASDQIRIDAHLAGLRALEVQLQGIAPSCPIPADPGAIENDGLNNEPIEALARAMSDLITIALSCDLTRVFNFRFTPSAADTYFHAVGATEAHHVMTHDPAHQAMVATIVHFTMQQLAYLLARMADTPDGDGSLLDHSVLYCVSELAEGISHVTQDMPVVIAGRGRGAHKVGQHLRVEGERSSSQAGLTVLRAAGVQETSFGLGLGHTTAVLEPLLTL